MTIANWCVMIACLLPTATVGLAKLTSRGAEAYNNKRPREWVSGLTGWKARANAAQLNGFEALPLFIAAVVLAQQAHADQGSIDQLAMAFIVARLVYIAMYLANQHVLRTLVWIGGAAISIAILALT
ncbi:glutathione metabolism protein [Duganella sp. FT135W]|uniref:Glutathione metabolism protein n=1 Tax=Duganella flavida TaxID=2692175 RepID=A0A6L8KBM4_9BURK|nr:MAPEG family protein [Duganella flavida]MYM24087.1 glutathione metabolism protein [Duganella flavida]